MIEHVQYMFNFFRTNFVFVLFIFFVCPKKTNQKKGPPITRRFTAVRLWRISCAAHKEWTIRKVASLRRIVFPLVTALLGYVIMAFALLFGNHVYCPAVQFKVTVNDFIPGIFFTYAFGSSLLHIDNFFR
jgi:hypothetical protein